MIRTSLRSLAVLCLFWAAHPVHADEQPFALLPGGVADREGKVGYVHAPAGGVDALDLATGKILWSLTDLCRPLALAGDRLVRQAPEKGKANAVRLLVLDTTGKGKVLRRSDAVEFPAWVSVGTGYGRSFTSSADLAGKDAVLLRWEARAWYAGGARPRPEIEQAARKQARGVARVDLASGKVEAVAAKEPPPVVIKDMAGVKPAQFWTGSAWQNGPVIVGKRAAVLLKGQADGQEKLDLQTWDTATGKPAATVELMRGKALWPQLGLDGRFVFVHQALVKEQLPAGAYAWSVFSLETGKRVAKVPFEPGSQSLTVVGPRLYYALEVSRGGRPGMLKRTRTLKAVDLTMGNVVWQHTLWAPPFLPPLP